MASYWPHICGLAALSPGAGPLFAPLSGVTVTAPTSEVYTDVQVAGSYTLRNLYARVRANAHTATTVIKTRKNGADGAQSLSITAAATGEFEDTSNTDSLVDGDTANYRVDDTAGSGTITMGLSVLAEAASDIPFFMTAPLGSAIGASTVYYPINGGALQSTTEANRQVTFRTAATLSNLTADLFANGAAGSTVFRTRINAGNGNQVLTYTIGQTGTKEDVTNTDSVSAGDEVNYSLVVPDTDVTPSWIGMKSASAGRQMVDVPAVNFAADRYRFIEGGITAITTESNVQVDARVAGNIKNLFVYVTANTTTAAGIYLRVNGGNSALTVAYASGETGVKEDTANTVAIVDGDDINEFIDLTSGTAITIQIISMEWQQVAAAPSPVAVKSMYYHLVGGMR